VIRAVAIPVQRAGDFRVNAIAEGTAPTPSDKASVYVRLSEEGDVQLFAQAEFTPIVARERAVAQAGFGAQPARRASVGKFEAGAQPSIFVGPARSRPCTVRRRARTPARMPPRSRTPSH
jgi:hypothetical protein